jgi:NADH-quinone oxidoreductase subunit I
MKVVDTSKQSLLRRFFLVELFVGLMVTLRHLFRSNVTEQYPKERPTFRPRFRGVPRLRDHEDVEGRLCAGCMQCAKVCPTNCITVITETRKTGKGKQPKVFLIDYERCCVCGLCAEVCGSKPIPALYMSHDYELAQVDRREFMADLEKLYQGLPKKEYKK